MPCEKLECFDKISKIFQENPKVKQLLTKLDGELQQITIDCKICDKLQEKGARAYITETPLQITLCRNKISQNEIEEVLVHELVHVYDLINNISDFSTCDGVAYSEIRAAKESECKSIVSLFGTNSYFSNMCSKSAAIRSTSNLYDLEQSKICVERNLQQAMSDLRPLKRT